jgi:peptidoglycan/xylan/chitin deacetylase (PgdA/CDA1 family)
MARLIVTTSWDDGSILDIKLGELLTKYGIKGTFYIPRFSKRITPMQKVDLLELAAKHEIGAHTLNHAHLTLIPQSEAKTEIEGSKYYLEDIANKKINMFCYPYGEFNEDIKQIVKASGFSGARTVKFNGFKDISDPYEFGITTAASNHQSDESGEIARYSQAVSIKVLSDWEVKARVLFDLALSDGGIWHLWGHSWEIDDRDDWNKLERVLSYVSNRPGVLYAANGETLDIVYSRN